MGKLLRRPKCFKFHGTEIRVKVKNILTKTLSIENYDMREKIGTIVHELDDGYTLVFFNRVVEKKIDIGRKIFKKKEYLQRYIHQDDLEFINF